jgi:hypothetical protein
VQKPCSAPATVAKGITCDHAFVIGEDFVSILHRAGGRLGSNQVMAMSGEVKNPSNRVVVVSGGKFIVFWQGRPVYTSDGKARYLAQN